MSSPRAAALSLILAAIASGAGGCRSKTEEERGHAAAADKASFLKGVGEGLKKEGEQAALAVGEGVGKVVKSATGGVAGGFTSYDVVVEPSATARGLQVSRAELRTDAGAVAAGGTRPVSAYLVAGQAYSGPVRLLALDVAKKEVGRSNASVTLKAGDAAYVDFAFDERTPMMQVRTVVLLVP